MHQLDKDDYGQLSLLEGITSYDDIVYKHVVAVLGKAKLKQLNAVVGAANILVTFGSLVVDPSQIDKTVPKGKNPIAFYVLHLEKSSSSCRLRIEKAHNLRKWKDLTLSARKPCSKCSKVKGSPSRGLAGLKQEKKWLLMIRFCSTRPGRRKAIRII